MIHPDNPDGDLPELGPLHKVLPAGEPLLPGHPDYPMTYTECRECGARTVSGQPAAHFAGCPLRSTQ
jgi:hypothetical protein